MLSSGFQVALLMSHICEEVDMYGFAGMEPRKYFDHETVQEKFLGAVAKWAQEVKDGVPVSYPFTDQRFRHRSLLGRDAEIHADAGELDDLSVRRALLGKAGKGRKKVKQNPTVAPVVQIEDVPNIEWERSCQADMILKGLVTIHGIHAVELTPTGKVPIAANAALQTKSKARG
ncbi:uncharacterized protein LOC142356345 [Convolutriloba macropyga]|uniref:uncharacterized protein LOC142356345 n=1 Tax=Convolutriloba macropyga TaxID=536237 RepID=UPI003F520C6C